jgi:hypothetical protein
MGKWDGSLQIRKLIDCHACANANMVMLMCSLSSKGMFMDDLLFRCGDGRGGVAQGRGYTLYAAEALRNGGHVSLAGADGLMGCMALTA